MAAVIAEENGNVIKLEHNQFVSINAAQLWSYALLWKPLGRIIKIGFWPLWREKVISQETGQDEYLSAILQKMDNGGFISEGSRPRDKSIR